MKKKPIILETKNLIEFKGNEYNCIQCGKPTKKTFTVETYKKTSLAGLAKDQVNGVFNPAGAIVGNVKYLLKEKPKFPHCSQCYKDNLFSQFNKKVTIFLILMFISMGYAFINMANTNNLIEPAIGFSLGFIFLALTVVFIPKEKKEFPIIAFKEDENSPYFFVIYESYIHKHIEETLSPDDDVYKCNDDQLLNQLITTS